MSYLGNTLSFHFLRNHNYNDFNQIVAMVICLLQIKLKII